MIKTTGPLVCICLALFASVCHQSFSFKLSIPTRHQQCLNDGFEGTCDFLNHRGVIEYNCTQLRCARLVGPNSTGKLVYIQRYSKEPVEGTYCGPSSFCSNGECIYSREKSSRLRYTGPENRISNCT